MFYILKKNEGEPVALKSTGLTASDYETSTHGSRSRRKLERVKGT
jgi:hypothetical protein